MNLQIRILTTLLALLGCALPASAQTGKFTPHSVDLFEVLPVQDGGRIKPVSTFADFTLLRLSGRKSVTRGDDAKTHLRSTEWLMEQAFFPELAVDEPVFLVSDAAALDAIGLAHVDKKKRDRYTFRELEPGLNALFAKANEYSHIEPKERNSVQTQIVNLAEAVQIYDSLSGHLDLALVPAPQPEPKDAEWLTPEEVALRLTAPMFRDKLTEGQKQVAAGFSALQQRRDDPGAFENQLAAVSGQSIAMAQARGEYGKIPLERFYYRGQFLFYGQIVFILAFLFMAFSWMAPKAKLPYRGAALFATAGTALVITAIVIRCIIRNRPPVSTLYETVLFITGVSTLVALVAERITRQRLALSAAAVLGMVGVFIANGYESLDKKDTMPSLVAVLDTNFWLATHVTAITVGYSAGMLAAVLGSFYLIAKAFGFRRDQRTFYSGLGRMVYGVLCFGVIFSTVGTILGGIWANDSWGRFWGWDPKENGALLIVLSQLVILHARMGGYLKEHGVCAAAAAGGMVVAFSWFGVNLLGVGLHSYGFTSGIHNALWTYYGVQGGIVLLGTYGWWRERLRAAIKAEARGEMPSHSSGGTRDGGAAGGATI
ncbi:MAG: cytochrome c biogenesis protein CcsA [Planctomycetes bacterium]|nr:cytochrome c biogenesis protein CcsA [Planctomycetota bacterium]